MAEMLNTWQPLPAIAIRCGLTNESAYRLLERLESDGRIISSSFRLSGNSKSRAYKLITYAKVLSMLVPLSCDSLDQCEHTKSRRSKLWNIQIYKDAVIEKINARFGSELAKKHMVDLMAIINSTVSEELA